MLALLVLVNSIKAQVLTGIPYQGSLRNSSGNYMPGVNITVKVSLIKDNPLATSSYIEKHSVITDVHGRYSVLIGEGLALHGIYDTIDWGSGIYYAVIAIDLNGSGVFESLGTELFAMVPYALYSKKSADGFSGDYNLLYNKPILFDGDFASLTEKPNTLSGYMINNGLDTLHPAYTITSGDLIVWDSSYNRGNHAGKYKLIGYFPEWSEVTNKPNFHPIALSGDYNDLQNLPQLYDSTWNSIKGRPIGEQDGDMLYWENNSWVNLHKGANGQKLSVASGKPTWQTSNKVKLATFPITGLLKNLKAKGYTFSSANGAIVSRGICWDTVDEPTLAGPHTSLAGGNGIFEVQLQGIDQFSTYYFRTFVITNTDTIYGNIENTTATTCGTSFLKNHSPANGVAPLAKTVQYSTVAILMNGQNMCWLAQNLGATNTAFAVNDSTESSAGWYFQFNLKQGYYHNGGSVRIPSGLWVNSNIGASGDWSPAQDPCTCELGTNWRMPNYSEWTNYMASIPWIGDWNVLWTSPLKLHAAGALSNSTSYLVARGVTGYYGSLSNTYRLRFINTTFYIESYPQSTALSVRCVAP